MSIQGTNVFYVALCSVKTLIKRCAYCVIILAFLPWANRTYAANISWVGATSTSWTTASNWSSGTVPANGDAVTIGPISQGNYSPTVANLEMGQWNKPISLLIRNSARLTVTGTMTIVASSAITLSSGGSLIHTGTSTTVLPEYGSGTMTITNGTFSTNGNFTVNNTMTLDTGRFTVNGNMILASGKTFTSDLGHVQVNGNFTMNNSGSIFHAGKDSVVVNGRLICNGNAFYGDTATIIINGNGTNLINGNFYTGGAHITFNPTSLTEITSGGRFYVNSGTVLFSDSVRVGSNGKLYANSGSVTFTKSILVSANGELDAGSGAMTFQGNATFSNSGTMNAGTAQVSFGGDVVINNSGGTINAGSATLTIAGDINNAGTFNAGTSTVVLAGDSTQTISNDITFYNLTVETEGTVQASGNVTVLNGGIIGANSEFVMPDPGDQLNVQGPLIDSSGTLAANTTKPFVMSVEVISSTEIVVVFNETISIASAENASNSTWTGRTISNRSRIDTNKLRLQFTPAITQNVEYTLTFQNIENLRNPVGTMSAGHTKKFTWLPPSAPTVQTSNLAITGSSDTSVTLSWTSGNGSSRVVFARQGSQINQTPSDGTSYSASGIFGAGDAIGSMYAVYQGTGNSVTVNGLESNKNYVFVVYEHNGSGAGAAYLSTSAPTLQTNTHVRVEIKIFLEGPFESGYMHNSLIDALPDTQVYSAAPWNYSGTEHVNDLPSDSIVDWVLVELRQASLPNQATDTAIVGRRAGFLLSNGNIVDLDGVSPLLIQTSRAGRMYAVVYHRSHLPVMSADSIVRNNTKFIYDFTNSPGKAFGSNAPLKELNTTLYGLYCGRIASDVIQTNDRLNVWNARNSTGYQPMDVNMDGVVDAGDRAQIWNNREIEAEVLE